MHPHQYPNQHNGVCRQLGLEALEPETGIGPKHIANAVRASDLAALAQNRADQEPVTGKQHCRAKRGPNEIDKHFNPPVKLY